MKLDSFKDLYVEQLRDLYSAETQLIDALPKMAQAAKHPELRRAFEEHLEQTRRQQSDLAQIISTMGANPEGHKCEAMAGLIREGQELLKEKNNADPDVLDAGLIAAAQRIEHYEIAGYGTVRTFAQQMGDQKAVQTLQRIADEEGETDKRLTSVAESVVNRDAQS